jgi:hypothetical protein
VNTLLNFFREGTKESSTRLVGILGFAMGILLGAFAVVASVWFGKVISIAAASVVALVLTHSGVALGLRKIGGEDAAKVEGEG